MDTSLRETLIELDKLGWEYPPDFNFSKELEEVQHIKPILERIIGHSLGENLAQDASFFVSLRSLDKRYSTTVEGGGLQPHISIVFSSFGKLVTVHVDKDIKDAIKYKAEIIDLLQQYNYNYIPLEVLSEHYPFSRRWNRDWTWYTRFFDYL